MKISKLFFTLIVCTILSGCGLDIFDCVSGEGPIIERIITLDSDIDEIELSIGSELIISEGATQEIIIEGQENLINLIEQDSRTDGSKWKIEIDNCFDADGIIIRAQLVEFKALKIEGSGNVSSLDTLTKVDDLKIDIEGSGNINFTVASASKIQTQIDGSGRVKLFGQADENDIDIDGSGKVLAQELEAKDVKVQIDGSGKVEVWAVETLDVDINGVGDVCYKGMPAVTQDVNGVGSVDSCQ